MANLYTRTGDDGTTALVGGSRVEKNSARVRCYGTIDEANSMLGMAYALSNQPYIRETVHAIQGKLFKLGAELASDEKGLEKLGSRLISQADVDGLERVVDHCTETTGKQTHFVIPGVNQASAALHVARTIVRRAERELVSIRQGGDSVRPETAAYVNRLSDAIYALARLEETLAERDTEMEELRAKVLEEVKRRLNGAGVTTAPGSGAAAAPGAGFDLEAAKAMAARAEAKSAEMGVPVVFSAVDAGGLTLLIHRMPGSLPGSLDVSLQKAYTANAFHMPTDVLGQKAQPGGELYGIEQTNQGRIVLFGGGYPVIRNGVFLGGVGVSGGTAAQDMEIAAYALGDWNNG